MRLLAPVNPHFNSSSPPTHYFCVLFSHFAAHANRLRFKLSPNNKTKKDMSWAFLKNLKNLLKWAPKISVGLSLRYQVFLLGWSDAIWSRDIGLFWSVSCSQVCFYLKCILLTDSRSTRSSPTQVWHWAASGTDPSETVRISRVWYFILWERWWVLSDFVQGKMSCVQRQTKMFSVFKKQNAKTTPKALQ